MESQPACRQRCGMHRVPWRDNSKGLRGQAGVRHMRDLSQRSGGATQSRSIHARQDVRELPSSTHLRGAQEGDPGRQVITISGSGILELLAGFRGNRSPTCTVAERRNNRQKERRSGARPFLCAGCFSGMIPQESPCPSAAADEGSFDFAQDGHPRVVFGA